MLTSARDRSRLLLGFDIPLGMSLKITSRLRSKLNELGLVLEGTGEARSAVHHTWRHLWVRDVRRRSISDVRVQSIREALRPGLSWIAPVQRDAEGRGSGLWATLPDALLVAARPGVDPDIVPRVLGAYGLREWVAKSRYLGRWRYFVIDSADWDSAERIAATILQQQSRWIADVSFELLAQDSPFLFDPNDIWYWTQWNLPRIQAPEAWDIARGRDVVVAVLDSGCYLIHPDLNFASPGINLDDMSRDGSPVGAREPEHGTRVAGIIGAGLNNIVGVAGLAGECRLLPMAMTALTSAVGAMGIRYALDHGARVLNISWSMDGLMFETSPFREAIEDAVTAVPGLFICASSGNDSASTLVLPARHPDVLACGASDHADMRWRTPPRGSAYGDSVYLGRPSGISVMAPGIEIHTTDVSGPGGPGVDGAYQYFNATSAAAPHVAAVAALLFSRYPTLGVAEVRRIVERTAEKVGGYEYLDFDGYPNGTRNPEMGYGRLNALRALDLGDVMIADWPGDDGVEPSIPPGGVYWETSDLIVRPSSTDDGSFDPTDPETASMLVPGLDHTVYARVRNAGPRDARNVHVETRVTPWVGTEFMYTTDWLAEDALHLRPTPLDPDISVVPAGGPPVLLRFTLTAAQVDAAAGWGPMSWHPCLLGVVTADNDYAFQTAPSGAGLQIRRNNLAQRNLSVLLVPTSRIVHFPFVIGNPANPERTVQLIFEAGRLPRDGEVQLIWQDNGGAFPVLIRAKALENGYPTVVKFEGGVLAKKGKRQTIKMTRSRMTVTLRLPRPGRYPLHLDIRLPRDAEPEERFKVTVAQYSQSRGIVGGATWMNAVGTSA